MTNTSTAAARPPSPAPCSSPAPLGSGPWASSSSSRCAPSWTSCSGARGRDYVREFLRSAGGRAHLEATLSAAEAADRAAMARDWRYGALCAFFGVVAAGLPEEALKYAPAAAVRWWRGRKQAETGEARRMSPREFVNYTVAAGIGFAVFENVGVVYGSVSGGNSTAEILLLLAERTFSALPGHVLCAALSGIRDSSTAARRRSADTAGEKGVVAGVVDMLSAILPSVLYHGVFDSFLLGVSAWCGHPGWVRPADPWVLACGYGVVVALQGLARPECPGGVEGRRNACAGGGVRQERWSQEGDLILFVKFMRSCFVLVSQLWHSLFLMHAVMSLSFSSHLYNSHSTV
ncbi:hypothetical protein PG997_003884 [Apiospora hydei]|uniref:PrsW family intramembrane metalloprotease n=1 Tax=Apiospora hydei TaxID=1337664 RepID=A0ABR1X0I8_9PEZI